MPTYNFIDTQSGVEFSDFISISEMETFLKENPHIELMVSAPAIVSGSGRAKPDESFRDILRNIKKGNSKGISRSTINTF